MSPLQIRGWGATSSPAFPLPLPLSHSALFIWSSLIIRAPLAVGVAIGVAGGAMTQPLF